MTTNKPAILIVEDEAIVSADLAAKLLQLGYTVAGSTARGENAVALARQLRPALVLMDIRLAGAMDGIEAAEAMRRECDLPVVYLTAHADNPTVERAIRAASFGYVLKPFEERELQIQIEMALYRHEADRQLRARDEQLRLANERLEQKVETRTAELAAQTEQLRALAGELTLAEQRERRRIAVILHDYLQQLLVAAKIRVAMLGGQDDDTRAKAIAKAKELMDECIRVSTSLTAELSPPLLYEDGLGPALEWLARWMADKHGLTVNLSLEPGLPKLAEDVKILMFESVRELLFNVVKHARVRVATVDARRVANDRLQVTISDAGRGFAPAAIKPSGKTGGGGFGLFSIRERLALFGGQFTCASAPGQGSRFTLCAPCGAEPAAGAMAMAP